MAVCDIDAAMDAAKCLFCLKGKIRNAVTVYVLTQLAGIPADPEALAELSKCFQCLDEKQLLAIITWIICDQDMVDDCSAETLMARAACLMCLDPVALRRLRAHLICTTELT